MSLARAIKDRRRWYELAADKWTGIRLYHRGGFGMLRDMFGCSSVRSCCQLGDCREGEAESEEWPKVMKDGRLECIAFQLSWYGARI